MNTTARTAWNRRGIYANTDGATNDSQDRVEQTYYKAPGSTAEVGLNTYTYDRMGNLYKVYAALAGRTYYMEYDLLDRLARVRDNDGCYYQLTYDANNQMTCLFHRNGSRRTKLTYAL